MFFDGDITGHGDTCHNARLTGESETIIHYLEAIAMKTVNIAVDTTFPQPVTRAFAETGNVFSTITQQFQTWKLRSQTRRVLADISRQALSDIGISKTEAILEASKPFWRA